MTASETALRKKPPARRGLETLLAAGEGYQPTYLGGALPLGTINVLPQPRKTFENLEELALDVARKRLLNPPTVARFTREDAATFLETVNRLWSTDFRIEALRATREDDAEVYYVLLAGERRFRACTILWERGCAECREASGEAPLPEGACFRKHFDGDRLEVRLCQDIPALAALFLQLSENTHMPVPPHEEAEAYGRLFSLLLQADPKYTAARFAREVGRSADTIRRALRYLLLPPSVRAAVESRLIAYGAALEIQRLQEAGLDEERLQFWVMRAATERKSVEQFREEVTRHLKERASGQQSLLGMFQENQAVQERAHVRRTVESQTIQAVWSWISYVARVKQLATARQIGHPGAPYSEDSPVRVLGRLTRSLEEALPLLEGFIPDDARGAMRDALDGASQQLALITA